MSSDLRIAWRMKGSLLGAATVAVVVTALVGLLGFLALRGRSWQTLPDLMEGIVGAGLTLLGIGVTAGLWIWALRVVRVSRRYGDAELELDAPARLGGRLRGRVRAEASLAHDEAVNLVLQCKGTRSGGGDSGATTWLRWDTETLLTMDDVEPANGELVLPIDLGIPADQPPTGMAADQMEFAWTLKVHLEPNTGYRPAFDIPVAPSDGSAPEASGDRDTSEQSSLDVQHRIKSDPRSAAADRTPAPPHARIRVEELPGGGTLVTPFKSRVSAFLNVWCLVTVPLWVVLPLWGLAELDGVESPPVIAYAIQLGIAFGGAFVLNGLPVLGQLFVNHSFRFGPEGVVVKRLLRRKRFSAGHFTACEAVGRSDGWMVGLERSATSSFGGLVVALVATETEARWLLAKVSVALGESLTR